MTSYGVDSSGLVFGLEICLAVSPLAIIRLKVKLWIISGRSVTNCVILREVVLLVPPLLLPGLDLRNGDVLLPVVSPVEFTGSRFSLLVMSCLLADAHAVEESDKK